MKKVLLLRLAAAVAGLICLTALGGCDRDADKPGAALAPAVVVAPVLSQTVPISREFVARTEARETVEIRARVEGFLEKVFFKEGSKVRAGQLIFLIDQRPYKAALQDAKGQLAQAKAAYGKANKDIERLKPLVAADAAPRQDLDKAESEAEFSRASIEKGKAAVARAELDLKFTEIRAPLTGIIGKEEVAVGNLVMRDRTLLTTMSSWDPMRAVFSISEKDYLLLADRFPAIRAQSERERGAPFELIMADGSIYPHRGRLSFVDRALDLTTGTLRIYVSFPNPEMVLKPGLFGRVRLVVEERPDTLLVPQKAVQRMQGVDTVLVVDPENKVSLRSVTLGERYQDSFIITDGLKPGERIIVEGLQSAIPGQKVRPTEQPPGQEKKGG
jgi:RND family efflux transporter MFP subunit